MLLAALLIPVASAPAAELRALVIPAGPLGRAVVALGRQANVSIGLTDPALARRDVPGLSGRMSVEAALARLLAGTGARHMAVDARTFRIFIDRAATVPARPDLRRAPAIAPTAPGDAPDIVVTALKRPVTLAAFPGSASVISGDDPAFAAGPRGSELLLGRLHTLTSTHFGPGRNKLFVRGIADSSFNGPTQATVGQYLGETRLNYNAPDPDLRLYDIDRIEVLPGPQGTLYGAGALGGIVRMVPNRPDTAATEGTATVGASTTRHGDPGMDAAAMLNLPVAADRLGLRLVGYGLVQGGYIDNPLTGARNINAARVQGGRAALGWAVDDEWRLTLAATGQRIRGDDAQSADRNGPPLTRAGAIDQPFANDYLLVDAVATRDWGEYRLVATTGLVRQKLIEVYDSTAPGGPPLRFSQRTRIDLMTGEVRLSRQTADGGPGWLIGASLVDNRSRQNRQLGPPGEPAALPGVGNEVFEATLFGEATLRPLDWLTVTAGGRAVRARLGGRPLDPVLFPDMGVPGFGMRADVRRNLAALLPSGAIAARLGRSALGFVRYQEGFRPGGLVPTAAFVTRFTSDRVRTVEAGIRYGQPDPGALDIQASAAFTRWTDIQADTIDLSGFPITANIGDGRIWTADLRIGWRPLPGLALEAAGLFNDSLVTDTLPSIIATPRARLPNVARWNGRASAEYRHDLGAGRTLRLNAALRYVGRSRLGIGPVLGEAQGGWTDVSAAARIGFGDHALTLSIANLLDATGNRFALGSPFTIVTNPQVTPLVPRTVRLGWDLRF
ncbi:TonB-dependent receptor [Sphingomonas changnyeongensis]|uniref:TonB-dependent receptor n=1 Tax=Sphingomonas changnyeongensis TaxID=2698679 RepID=A0A7Z2NYL3_9SPHN|nr:TonB-dependent receptor [Sphingomonas changnyeongensis]